MPAAGLANGEFVDLLSQENGLPAHLGSPREGEAPDMIGPQDPDSAPPFGRPGGGATPKRIKVGELLRGEREVILEHDGQDYRLRITANGKLILTK